MFWKNWKTRCLRPSALTLVPIALFCIWIGAYLPACTPVKISDDATPTDTVPSGTASLLISNFIKQDPGTLTFYLYPATAVDWVSATVGKRIDSVQAESTRVFLVPAGSWKIAYFNRSKSPYPMIDENSGSQEWLRSDFKKNQNYSLVLKTDGNRTLWVPSYVTVPPITP